MEVCDYPAQRELERLREEIETARILRHQKKRKTLLLICALIVVCLIVVILSAREYGIHMYNSGFDIGYTAGLETGYQEGLAVGYANGEADGYDSGVINQRSTKFVYVTPSGEKYHLKNCSYIKSTSSKIPLDDALKNNDSPCNRCKPPKK